MSWAPTGARHWFQSQVAGWQPQAHGELVRNTTQPWPRPTLSELKGGAQQCGFTSPPGSFPGKTSEHGGPWPGRSADVIPLDPLESERVGIGPHLPTGNLRLSETHVSQVYPTRSGDSKWSLGNLWFCTWIRAPQTVRCSHITWRLNVRFWFSESGMSLRAGINWQGSLGSEASPVAAWPHLGTDEPPSPDKSETLGVGPSGPFNKPFRWF